MIISFLKEIHLTYCPNGWHFLKSESVIVSYTTRIHLIPVLLRVDRQTIQLTTAGSARRSCEVFVEQVTFSVFHHHENTSESL